MCALWSPCVALQSSMAMCQTYKCATLLLQAGFKIEPGCTPIVPIMLGDAKVAGEMAQRMLERGVYVVGFSYPVVPKGKARIRVQLSAAHEQHQIERTIEAFTTVGKELGVL